MLALKIVIFLLTLCLGIIASALDWTQVHETSAVESATINHDCHPRAGEVLERGCLKHQGDEIGSASGSSSGDMGSEYWKNAGPTFGKSKLTKPLKVTYKQKAQYTAEARSNGIQGTVTLRVTFLASGGIGSITTVRGLPFGLTEQAIEAAREIKFEPEEADAKRRTTTRPVSFTFNIY